MAGLIMPVAITGVADSMGWRTAFLVLAVFIFAIVIPVALVMRRRPEDYGMLPDGTEPGGDRKSGRLQDVVEAQNRDAANSYTRSEALRTPGIWLLISGYALHHMAILAVLMHAIPFMTDNGLTRAEAALALALNGGANLLSSKLAWANAYLLQRMHAGGPLGGVGGEALRDFSLSTAAAGVVLMLVSAYDEPHRRGVGVGWG